MSKKGTGALVLKKLPREESVRRVADRRGGVIGNRLNTRKERNLMACAGENYKREKRGGVGTSDCK